ncbi:MAG: MFS transporter [Gemmatimonadota bacterium]
MNSRGWKMKDQHDIRQGRGAGSTSARPRLMTRSLTLLFIVAFGTTLSFYLLLSVVPLYAASVGAGGIGAGLATGALMLSTVAAEFVTPRLVTRFGYRVVLIAGILLLGAPSLGLIGSASMTAIFVVCLVRGLGFAITVVVGGSLAASLSPEERRGEGLGLYGVVCNIAGVLGLPLGVWLVAHAGYPTVFMGGALAAMAGLLVIPAMPAREPHAEPAVGMMTGLRNRALLRPSVVFFAIAMAGGIVVTFLPLAVGGATASLVPLALFAQAASATAARWWAGRVGDRHGSSGLLMPSLVVSAVGILMLVAVSNPVVVLLGMVVFGAGFGVAQNASMAIMFERVSRSGYDAVSAIWNLAYDGGFGVGATGYGILAEQTGYPVAFASTALVMLVALIPALRDRSVGRGSTTRETDSTAPDDVGMAACNVDP